MFLSFGERVLNEQIRASTAAREKLVELDGKRLAVRVRDTDLRILIHANGDRLELTKTGEGDCDVELTAGLFDLARLARASGLSALKSTDATLNGDIRLAEAFSEVLRLAVPDLEGLLADWLGDTPAYVAGVAARGFSGWAEQAGRSFEQNVAEYLQEESPHLPPPALGRYFLAEVERIRDDVERAEQRLEKLERRLLSRV